MLFEILLYGLACCVLKAFLNTFSDFQTIAPQFRGKHCLLGFYHAENYPSKAKNKALINIL